MKPPADDETTGLPGLRSWKQVYGFVLVVLAVWVGLLTMLGRMFA
ncbi:MAG TPA: hypothetical protein VII43_08655 [Opitutaceae bacterium]